MSSSLNPFEYDPGTNSWTTKSATYPDGFTNNMACSVLNDSGTDYIYCVGGSKFATQTTAGRVFRYDPIADSITTVASDWPPGDVSILPGGFTVFNNKLYILGGFDIPNGVGTDQIWEFTPNPAGWVQKSAVLPVPLGYIPTTTIGSLIYTGGGVDITGGALTDTTNSFVYDPVADSINTIADIPTPTSNTRAVNFCNQMYVLGGGFNTPSNEVDIYDPVSNTWSVGAPFATAGRNFAADTDGTNNIWKAGGYAEYVPPHRLDGNLQLPGESLWVAYAYTHATCNGDANGNCHSDRNSHSHAHGDTNTDAVRRKVYSDAAASSNSSASPIAPVAASLCEAETWDNYKRG